MSAKKWYTLDLNDHRWISVWDEEYQADEEARALMEKTGHTIIVARDDHIFVKNAKVVGADSQKA